LSREVKSPNFTWFREAAPFIHQFRGKVFVFFLSGDILDHPNFRSVLHDIALLYSLGVKVALVHGARAPIDQALAVRGLQSEIVDNVRVTDDAVLDVVKQTVAAIALDIAALLSMSLVNTPMFGARLRVISGNFITAQPIGVCDGVDFLNTGVVRKVDGEGIRRQLDYGCVLLSGIGFSPSGQIFNLHSEDVATAVAVALQAEKYIIVDKDACFQNAEGKALLELTTAQARVLPLPDKHQRNINSAVRACDQGVTHAHILDIETEAVVLRELLTVSGSGLLISAEPYETITPAAVTDIPGIFEIIRPLEEAAVLVKRERGRLEMEIANFQVLKRGGAIIGVVACYPYPDEQTAELACLAVHPDYRGDGRGDRILRHIERYAKSLGLSRLFVLSTQTADWFVERGFVASSVNTLPALRQSLYNFQRNSRVFSKKIA
jgi:amino-acid N-acetyltransferase